jgi:hypothetical protein
LHEEEIVVAAVRPAGQGGREGCASEGGKAQKIAPLELVQGGCRDGSSWSGNCLSNRREAGFTSDLFLPSARESGNKLDGRPVLQP